MDGDIVGIVVLDIKAHLEATSLGYRVFDEHALAVVKSLSASESCFGLLYPVYIRLNMILDGIIKHNLYYSKNNSFVSQFHFMKETVYTFSYLKSVIC